ncbi:MAG: hypothetical protein ACMVP2_10525 [Imperialibacter sp.]
MRLPFLRQWGSIMPDVTVPFATRGRMRSVASEKGDFIGQADY